MQDRKPQERISRVYIINMTLLLLLLMGQPLLLKAQPDSGDSPAADRAPAISEEEAEITRRQASERATEAYAGRVLNIRFRAGYWVLRMDHEGTVFNVRVDALEGEVIGPDEEAAAEREAAEQAEP